MHHWKPRQNQKKDHNPWFDKDVQKLKTQRRLAEKRWIKSKQHEDLIEYKHINSIYKKHLHHSKKTHKLSKLNDNENKARDLYKILRLLTKLEDVNPMPLTESPSDLPDKCAYFFLNKIKKIREQFHDQNIQKSYHRKFSGFNSFLPLDREEILNIIKNKEPTTCIMDPCKTKFLSKGQGNNSRCHHHYDKSVPHNRWSSWMTGKWLSVRPLIKGLNMDTELKNYRPISNLSFPSKITEKAAQLQLQKTFWPTVPTTQPPKCI